MRSIAKFAAVAWLLVLAPAELAAALVRLISMPPGGPGLPAATLIALRVLVTAGGLMLGRRLASGTDGTRLAALTWAAADLGTLCLVLASGALPHSRAPGDAPIVWGVYAMAAVVVVVAAASAPSPGREARAGGHS